MSSSSESLSDIRKRSTKSSDNSDNGVPSGADEVQDYKTRLTDSAANLRELARRYVAISNEREEAFERFESTEPGTVEGDVALRGFSELLGSEHAQTQKLNGALDDHKLLQKEAKLKGVVEKAPEGDLREEMRALVSAQEKDLLPELYDLYHG